MPVLPWITVMFTIVLEHRKAVKAKAVKEPPNTTLRGKKPVYPGSDNYSML